MNNKQILIEAIKNLNKAKAPARKKDVVINQRQPSYMQQTSLPTAKKGGESEEREFVNSQEHGIDTPIYADLDVRKSKIHGQGVFSNQPIKEGTVVGISHVRKEFEKDGEMYQAPFPSKILGLYNHNKENPNITEIDNGDYISIIAIRNIQPGEELIANYYNNDIKDLEKPEDFKNELAEAGIGGSVNNRVLRDLDRDLKDPRRSRRFSKSLLATNQLFAPNYLFNKPSSRRIYNPNAKYFRNGGFTQNDLINYDGPRDYSYLLDEAYSKFPGLEVMKDDLKILGDPSFTRDATGIGDIEFFGKNDTSFTYPTGLEYPNPNPGGYGIPFNPKTTNSQGIALDMLHGMDEASPEYKKLKKEFGTAFMNSKFKKDFEEEVKWLKKEVGENKYNEWYDSDDVFFDHNYIDGIIRNLLYEGTPEDFKRDRYWDKAQEIYLADPGMKETFGNLKKYLTTKPVTPDEYIQAELSKEEIDEYVKGGYVVEELLPKADKGLIAKMLKPLVAGTGSSNNIVKGLSRGIINKGIDLSAIIAPTFMKGLAKDAMGLSKGNANYNINSYLHDLTSKDLDLDKYYNDDLNKWDAYQGLVSDAMDKVGEKGRDLDRNLLDLYLGDDSKFKEARWLSELESEGINSMKSYTDRHGPLKSYELFSQIPNKEPLSALKLFSNMEIANPHKSGGREVYDDFLEWRNELLKRTKKNPENPDEVIDAYNYIFDEYGDDVIPFEINAKAGYLPNYGLWRNPISPIDDVAGHMAFLKRTGRENFDFTTRDVWGFHPKNYSNKWLSNQITKDDYFKNLSPKLLDKFGKPFILTQTNPLHFDFVRGKLPFEPLPINSTAGISKFAKPPKPKSLGGELPRGDKGLITKLGQWATSAKNVFGTAKNTIKGATGFTNYTPSLSKPSYLSKSSLLKNVDPETMQLMSHLKDANLISPTLNESLLSTYPNLLNLATKKGIQDALTFTRSTTPNTVEGISSSGTRTPISNTDLNAFKKFGLLEDEPGMAMYTASHVPGMRYGRRDGLSLLPYKSQFVGGVEQGTPTSLDALYTFPNNSGLPEDVQEGIFGDTYGNYATILRYPFDYSGSALDMFNRYKTFENAVFDKAAILKKYRGSRGALSGDIGALNFKDQPTLDNAFYQSIWNSQSEVPFIGNPGEKVLQPVATYTKPVVKEIKAERNKIDKLNKEGKYEEVINLLNEKVKSGDFGSVDSNIESYKINSEFPRFDVSKYNLRDEYDYTEHAPFTLSIFDPKTGLIPVKGDLKSIANNAWHAYYAFISKGPLMDAYRDPSNVVKYPFSPLKYKFKKGGQLPKADKGLITKIPELLNFTKSATILDDLLLRTNNLWKTPQGISRLNEMIVNTPSLNSLNVTPEAMITDLSNITNLNHISHDAVNQQKIFLENQTELQQRLRNANNANATKGEKNLISAEQGRNRMKLFQIQKKIDNLKEYYPGPGRYQEPRHIWESENINPFDHSISIGSGLLTAGDVPMVGKHEITHFPGIYYGKLSGKGTRHTYLDEMLSKLDLKSDSELLNQSIDFGTPLTYNLGNAWINDFKNVLQDKFGNDIPGHFQHPLIGAKNYYQKNIHERSPMFSEAIEKMVQDGFINNSFDFMTPKKLEAYYKNYINTTGNKFPLRYFEIMRPNENNLKLSSDVFNKMLIGLPAVGAAALGSDLDEKAVGGPALGDEVDEVTMERLKEQGYTFEKI